MPRDFLPVDPDGRIVIHGPEVEQDVRPFQPSGTETSCRYQTASMKSVWQTPDSSDSGQNGTVILSVKCRLSRFRARPLSPPSISNSHSPLRQAHSGRTN